MLALSMEHQMSVYLLFIALSGLVHAIRRRLARQSLCRARGCEAAKSKAPVKDPFIGFDFLYGLFFGKAEDRYLESTHHAFQSLGPTYTVDRWSCEVIYTCDSRNIKHLLTDGFQDFALPRVRVSALETLLGRGIFTLNGPSWRHARSVLKPMLARLDKEAVISKLEHHFQAMLGLVPDDASAVDLQSLFFRLAMDFAGDYVMGKPAGMLGKPTARHGAAEQFVDDYMTCSREVVKKLGFGPLQRLRFSPGAFGARRRVFRYMDGLMDESLAQSRGTMLSELAAVTEDRKVLRDQVLHLLVAGRDTTASMLSNLFFVLARKPATYRRLRQEVLAVAGLEAPTATQLRQMEYVRWCVSESLRLHPVIPTNAREAARDTTMPHGGGPDGTSPLLVRKGVVVMYNTYALHRDAAVFGADPEAFVPERWRSLRPGWGYLPFSGGPRICMGQQLALTEAHYVVARMAQTFEAIEGHGETDWVELYALATTCRDGVNVSLRRA